MNDYHTEYLRGDIWFVRGAKSVTGSEPAGDRPAVIVSNDTGNKYSPNVEVVFLTSREKKPLPTHVPVLGKVPSTAMCENVQTISKERLEDFIRACTTQEMKAIDNALLCSFGLIPPAIEAAPVPIPVSPVEEKINIMEIELSVYKTLYEQLLDRITIKS